MSYSFTATDIATDTDTATFTVTHARHLAAKVATDLKRMQRFYGQPTDAWISAFEAEATALLKAGYLDKVTYGFQKNGRWVEPTLTYSAKDLLGASSADDDPGLIRPGRDVSGAEFHSYLSHNAAWIGLTPAQREAFDATLPVTRSNDAEPGTSGYLVQDRTYSSGGRALTRSSGKGFGGCRPARWSASSTVP